MDVIVIAVAISVIVLIGIWVTRSMGGTRQSARKPQLYQEAPPWISLDPAKFQPGHEYCRLRADWVSDNPVRSHVEATYASGSGKRGEVISEAMTFNEFVQLEKRFISEGWKKAYNSNDKEGETVYFMRSKA